MKFKVVFTAVMLFSLFSFSKVEAQAPQGINYQAVARNAGGSVLISQSINIRASVISGTSTGTPQWVETHTRTTNQFGLFDVVIGTGTYVSGAQTNFSNINWASGNHYLKIEVDFGAGYVDMGTTQLVSVPYALLANKVVTQPSLNELTDVSTSGVTNGQVLKYNGSSWTPANDNTGSGGSAYTAGTGININGSNVISATNLGGDVTGTVPVNTVTKIQGVAVSATTPTNNQVLKYNSAASQWLPAADNNTTYTAGTGIDVTGTVIKNTAPDQTVTLAGTGGTSVTGTYPNFTINSSSSGTTYTAGTGISINGSNVISNTGDTNASDDITTSTSAGGDLLGTYPNPNVAKLRGTSVANAIPTTGQVLKFDGTQWSPGTDNNTGTTYTAGTGISINGSNQISNTAPGITYTAGTGIDVTGTVIATKNLGGDVTGTIPATTVAKIQGKNVSASAPADGQVLQYNSVNSQWQPTTLSSSGMTTTSTSSFSTSQITVTPLDNYLLIPGLSQTINVPANSTIIISTNGGIQSLGATSNSFSAIQIAISIDGFFLPKGGVQFVQITNATIGNGIGNWSLSQSLPVDGTIITAGSHTISVNAQFDDVLYTSPNATSVHIGSPNNNSVLQSALTITVIKN